MSTTKPTSLLGDPSPELVEKLKEEDERNQQIADRTGLMLELLLEGYRSGELSFESHAKICSSVIRYNISDDKPHTRDRWLGKAIAAALGAERNNPGRGKKGVPQPIRAAALEILEAVRKREGLPLTHNPGNAYERCCEIFTNAGFGGISPLELEKWRHKAKKQ
jgi:hypothetical protein